MFDLTDDAERRVHLVQAIITYLFSNFHKMIKQEEDTFIISGYDSHFALEIVL